MEFHLTEPGRIFSEVSRQFWLCFIFYPTIYNHICFLFYISPLSMEQLCGTALHRALAVAAVLLCPSRRDGQGWQRCNFPTSFVFAHF